MQNNCRPQPCFHRKTSVKTLISQRITENRILFGFSCFYQIFSCTFDLSIKTHLNHGTDISGHGAQTGKQIETQACQGSKETGKGSTPEKSCFVT
jgi:hypothetical protein